MKEVECVTDRQGERDSETKMEERREKYRRRREGEREHSKEWGLKNETGNKEKFVMPDSLRCLVQGGYF